MKCHKKALPIVLESEIVFGFVHHIFNQGIMFTWWNNLPRELQKVCFNLVSLGVYLGVCVLFYYYYENWTPAESLFFAVTTMTTVGYGYKVPSDDNSRLFTVFIMIFGVFMVFGGINNAVTTRMKALRKNELKTMGHHLSPTELYRLHQAALFRTLMFIIIFLFIAAGIFCGMEDWTFIKGLYFAVQTATTIGYGDMDLRQGGTNAVLSIYIVLSTTLVFFAFNNFRTLHDDFQKIKEAAKLTEKKQTLAKLKELDTGNGVPMDTFILAVLEQLGTLDRARDIEPWIKKFKEMDTNNSGKIDSEEIEQFSQAEATNATLLLQDLRAVTSASNNVAVASLHDMGQGLADALSLNPLMGNNNDRTRSADEVHLTQFPSSRPTSPQVNAPGSSQLNYSHNQMHKVPTSNV